MIKVPIVGEIIPNKKMGNRIKFFSIRCPKCNNEIVKINPILVSGEAKCRDCHFIFKWDIKAKLEYNND